MGSIPAPGTKFSNLSHARRIGIFGGTFNPVHLAHLVLAQDALEQAALDQVIFLPCWISPFKTRTRATIDPEHRWKMIQRAIRGIPRFSASRVELDAKQISYSFYTVCKLQELFPARKWFFMIGDDQLHQLSGWHRAQELCEKVTFLVMNRGVSKDSKKSLPKWIQFRRLRERRMDISSTEIRERVSRGLPIDFQVTSGVEKYIRKHHLYLKKDVS